LKLWQFGAPGSLLYRIFDLIRRKLDRDLVHFLAGLLGPGKDKVLMEAGSGPGYGSSLLANVPWVRLSIAVDIDPAALAEARKRDHILPAVIADLDKLPFKSAVFDLVWNSSTMEHLVDPLPALMEFSRLVKDKGLIFIGVPYLHGPLGIQKLIPHTKFGIWIGSVFDHESLRKLLLAAGFRGDVFHQYFMNFFIGIFGEKPPIHYDPTSNPESIEAAR
jgi:SAM-dependent methyltransferase